MADSRIKGITIEINGDVTGLNKALESTNKKLSSSQRQLKDVERLLKLDPKNTELLAQKQRLLGDSISATKEKLEKLKKAEQQAAAKLGTGGKEAQEQYEALRREIISTENYLGKLEKQAADTGKSLDNAGDDGAESIEKAGDAAQDAKGKVSGFGSAAKAAGVAAAAAFAAAAAAAVAAAKALVDMTVGGAAYADTVLTESTVTGIATDKLQEYMYAAELVDVSTETLTKSMAKNIKSMKSAADGSTAYAEAYEALGVSVTSANGELRDGEAVYWEAIDALGQLENETERDALAMQLFGKSAQELNPMIEAGAKRMQELGEKAHEAGYVISDDMLNSYGALDDQLRYLEGGAAAAKNALGTILLPALTDLATDGVDLLGEFTNGILDADGDIGKMSDVIRQVLPKAIDSVMEFVPELIEVGGELISALGAGIIDNLPQIADAAVNVVVMLIQGLVDSFPQLVAGAEKLIKSVLSPKVIKAVVSGISKLAPEVSKAGVEIGEALIEGVLEIIKDPEMLLDVGDSLIESFANLAAGILDVAFELDRAVEDLLDEVVKRSAKEGRSSGEEISNGIAKGVAKKQYTIENAAEKAAKAVVLQAKKAADQVEKETAEIIASAAAAGEAFSEMQQNTDEEVSGINSRIDHVVLLANELFNLADASGKVAEADKGRAQFIIEQLNDALGTEYTMTGNVISQYYNLKNAIFDVIEAKRASAMLSAYEDDYQEAMSNKEGAAKAASSAQENYNAKLQEYNAINAELARQEAFDPGSVDPKLYTDAANAYAELADAETAYLQAIDNLQKYEAVIQKYEGAYVKILDGDYTAAQKILNGTFELIDSNERAIIDAHSSAVSEYRNDWQEVLNEQGAQAANRYARTYGDVARNFNKWYAEMLGIGGKVVGGFVDGVSDGEDGCTQAVAETVNNAIRAGNEEAGIKQNSHQSSRTRKIGEDMAEGMIAGLKDGESGIASAMRRIINSALEAGRIAADSHSPSRKMIALGEDMGDGGVIGVKSKTPQMRKAGGNLALSMLDGFADFADTLTSNMAISPAALIGVPTPVTMQRQSSVGATYNSSVSLGGISVYVNASNVDNVEVLADLVADRINTSIIEKQAVYTQ